MVSSIPLPQPRKLLPPFLACLPAAVSSRPPPALLPLLSPILRHRVQLFTSSVPTQSQIAHRRSTTSWLPLLCWHEAVASKLPAVIEKHGDKFELHPVSGEIEFDALENESVKYRRMDEETLQSQFEVTDLELLVTWLWCQSDQEGGGDGWRITGVELANEGYGDSETPWAETLGEAETAFKQRRLERLTNDGRSNGGHGDTRHDEDQLGEDDDDDDAYWGQYDDTPARTPAVKRSPAPQTITSSVNASYPRQASEDVYFARYLDVQPAMDGHDPEEAVQLKQNGNTEDQSTLGGTKISNVLRGEVHNSAEVSHSPQVWGMNNMTLGAVGVNLPLSQAAVAELNQSKLSEPRPASTSSNSSDAVKKLEQTAEKHEQGEIAVKQHISTSMKSLYRLARAAGIERHEFKRFVRTELDVLGFMEEEN